MNVLPVALISLSFVLGCSPALDEKRMKANESFMMKGRLIGTVLFSSDPESVGKPIIISGLDGDAPEYLSETGISFPLRKTFEDDRKVALTLAGHSSSGAVDAFVIDKKSGKFSRAELGFTGGVYSVSSLGVFQ